MAGHPRHDGHHPLVEGRLADLGAGLANERGDVLHHPAALGREVLGDSGLCPQRQQERCGDDTGVIASVRRCVPRRIDLFCWPRVERVESSFARNHINRIAD